MTARRILIVDRDARSARELTRAARATAADGAEVVVSDGHEVPAGAFDDVLLAAGDDDHGAKAAADMRHDLLARFPGRVILCAAPKTREVFADLLEGAGVAAVLARPLVPRDVMVTLRKRATLDIFGIEKYFPWGTPLQTVEVRSNRDRDGALAAAHAFAERVGLRPRLAEMFATLCDELLTNALYDAPVDAEMRPRHRHLRRGAPVELADGERIDVRWCTDGETVACSVIDPFGALDTATVQQYLGRCLRRGADQMSERSGGAGLGLFTVLEASSHVVVNIAPTRRTEVIALINIEQAFRGLSERAKSLSVFCL